MIEKFQIINSKNNDSGQEREQYRTIEVIREQAGLAAAPGPEPDRDAICRLVNGTTVIGNKTPSDPIGVITIRSSDPYEYTKNVNYLLSQGYKIASAYCGGIEVSTVAHKIYYTSILLLPDDFILGG